MKIFNIALVVLFLSGFGSTVQAQNAIPASGGNASGSGGTASFTIGQAVYATTTNSNGSVSQGVQQPYEISVITAIEEARGILLEIMVYPNPATDFIKLKIEKYEFQNFRYQLYDINGSILQDNKIIAGETDIVMSNYVSATYFLQVTDNKRLIRTFKIIKH
jgi:hypothetical protein